MDAARFRRGSESERTYRLKWAAWEWRYNTAGCRCIGFEARRHGPWGRIVDVAAVGPGNRVYVVEVKSSRANFTRDNHTDADVARLRQRAAALSRRIALAETPGYCSRNDDRERLARERERLRERLATISTKFHDPRFLAAADYYYIMAPTGAAPTEMLPPQWGLLGRNAVGGGKEWGHIGNGVVNWRCNSASANLLLPSTGSPCPMCETAAAACHRHDSSDHAWSTGLTAPRRPRQSGPAGTGQPPLLQRRVPGTPHRRPLA